MRMQVINCKYRYQAVKAAPWASVIRKVTDGYACFESWDDYYTWRNQK